MRKLSQSPNCFHHSREGIQKKHLFLLGNVQITPSPLRANLGNFFTLKKVSKSIWARGPSLILAMPKRKKSLFSGIHSPTTNGNEKWKILGFIFCYNFFLQIHRCTFLILCFSAWLVCIPKRDLHHHHQLRRHHRHNRHHHHHHHQVYSLSGGGARVTCSIYQGDFLKQGEGTLELSSHARITNDKFSFKWLVLGHWLSLLVDNVSSKCCQIESHQ